MTQHIAVKLIRRFPFLTRLPFLVYRRFQARFTAGVVAAVFDDADRVLLVEHAWHPRHPWGLPGGWVDADEDPSLAVQRELREELQLRVRLVQTLHIARHMPNHLDIAFLCRANGDVGELSAELLDYRWARRDELPAMHAFHRTALDIAFDAIKDAKK